MTKDYKYIEDLLERFFDGETSNEEEKELYRFFSREDIPEHLLPYKQVFHYFESELEEELRQVTEAPQTDFRTEQKPKKHWLALAIGVAASLLILLMLSPLFMKETSFNPYEGSYIVRNGKRITNPEVIRSELEATVRQALQEEKEASRLFTCLSEQEQQYDLIEQQIEQQQEEILNSFSDKGLREEVKRILKME
ncbi:hypothetical protein M2459_003240 [Parabacteroides sp. PF5-5]|uniref:hypothetical protein n=1 Tax=unclassified Parabacteroides TaxID=2649774 RepID=UPI0024755573|nr:MULTISPECIES: hypothetical protein [unclassified Parabacteroides]MDH6306504.1 hypothetical protein [Parabacteroides sp. PH5-39]MDH6317471.1 hypothetical protein [Parabacteroides sp. PF5-13]MDH6321226.1 hypothetical protein [Parabacteroides sp. PH5-13]MDH6324958.1 hypothetical protein [Parabacteroides sp. PH5-8]MDH6328667.1 hypothetical protein [Parabacteroides sp. PH5-41]